MISDPDTFQIRIFNIPRKRMLIMFWVNLLFFQVIWFGSVLWQQQFIAIGILLICAHLIYQRSLEQAFYVVIAAMCGVVLDSILTNLGFYHFSTDTRLIPGWLILLWVAFACTIDHSLAWLKQSKSLQFVAGSIAGPLSYLAGYQLGAVDLVLPAQFSVGVLAIVWGPFLVFLFYLNRIYQLQPETNNHVV